jgi:hypothetical protein
MKTEGGTGGMLSDGSAGAGVGTDAVFDLDGIRTSQ